MTVLLRTLARLVAFVLLVALCLGGLVAIALAVSGGDEGLASFLRLPALRDWVGPFLGDLEAGEGRGAATLAGTLAVGAGLLLLYGALRRAPSGELVFDVGGGGRTAARRRPLSQASASAARQVRGVTDARVRVKPRGRGAGGRIDVLAMHPLSAEPTEVRDAVTAAVEGIAGGSGAVKVRTRTGRAPRGERAE